MKCSGENEILRGAFRLVSHVTVHFVLYPGNFGLLFGQCTCIGTGYYTKIYYEKLFFLFSGQVCPDVMSVCVCDQLPLCLFLHLRPSHDPSSNEKAVVAAASCRLCSRPYLLLPRGRCRQWNMGRHFSLQFLGRIFKS